MLIGSDKLNGLIIHVEEENANLDVDIPTHKVEKGIPLSDHVERKPREVKLSGKLIRKTPEELESLINKLEKIETNGTLVVYEGRRIYTNMMLHGLNISANSKIINGYEFSCTLTEVRIGKTSYVPPKRKAVTAKPSNSGRKQTQNKKQSPIYHIVKRGDTYIGLGKKYNIKWQQIQKWNGYPPRRIPIGVKMRVG